MRQVLQRAQEQAKRTAPEVLAAEREATTREVLHTLVDFVHALFLQRKGIPLPLKDITSAISTSSVHGKFANEGAWLPL